MTDCGILNKINIIKRKQVMACIEVAKKYDKIRKMAIFGSSVRDDCTEESDVDICLWIDGTTHCREMYELSRDINIACEYNCDILKYHKLKGRIKEDIDKKGIIVYELP